MSEEAKTEIYGFTVSAMTHLLGDGEDLTDKDLHPISVHGEDPDVARLIIEMMAAAPQKHWKATVEVPENADVNTKIWATVLMSDIMWELTKKLIESKHPNVKMPWKEAA